MPMCDSFARLVRDRHGHSALEMALVLPIFLLLFLVVLESGRVYYQSSQVERGLRAGALFAARNDLPLTTAATTATENLIKRGTTDSSQPYLVKGWSNPSASYYVGQHDYNMAGEAVPVIRVIATVPFEPLFPDLLNYFNLSNAFMIRLGHEQSFVDD